MQSYRESILSTKTKEEVAHMSIVRQKRFRHILDSSLVNGADVRKTIPLQATNTYIGIIELYGRLDHLDKIS